MSICIFLVASQQLPCSTANEVQGYIQCLLQCWHAFLHVDYVAGHECSVQRQCSYLRGVLLLTTAGFETYWFGSLAQVKPLACCCGKRTVQLQCSKHLYKLWMQLASRFACLSVLSCVLQALGFLLVRIIHVMLHGQEHAALCMVSVPCTQQHNDLTQEDALLNDGRRI